MRHTLPSAAILCLLAAFAASPAGAQANANATVCAADDDSAFSPEQRMAACDAVIKAARNAPKAGRGSRSSIGAEPPGTPTR